MRLPDNVEACPYTRPLAQSLLRANTMDDPAGLGVPGPFPVDFNGEWPLEPPESRGSRGPPTVYKGKYRVVCGRCSWGTQKRVIFDPQNGPFLDPLFEPLLAGLCEQEIGYRLKKGSQNRPILGSKKGSFWGIPPNPGFGPILDPFFGPFDRR